MVDDGGHSYLSLLVRILPHQYSQVLVNREECDYHTIQSQATINNVNTYDNTFVWYGSNSKEMFSFSHTSLVSGPIVALMDLTRTRSWEDDFF